MFQKKLNLPVLALVFLILFAAGCSAQTPATAPAVGEPVTGAAQPTTAAQPTQAYPATAAASGNTSSGGSSTSGGTATGGLQFTLVPGKSEARYRVREQLANRDLPSDAIGKTSQVSGSVTIKPDGTIDSAASKVVVDASTLQTDESMRDNYVRRNVLQTSQYPNVTFVPTAVSGLANPLPQSGPVNFQITGNLTIRDVTKPVTWTVTGNVQNGQASGTATTSFTFEDFNLNQPRVPVVLSVVDKITLEMDVTVQSAK
jgi:polyisoprenoid-binding protein YceI